MRIFFGSIDFMLIAKTLTEYTIFFSPNNFKKTDDIILNFHEQYLQMDDFNKTPNIYPSLNAIPLSAANISNEQQFKLNEINEIKDYFLAEIRERELAKISVSIFLL